MGTYIISDCVEPQSRDEKKHIVTKDVVGLLLGDVVSTKKLEVCPYRDSSLGNRDPYVGILVPTRPPSLGYPREISPT